MDWTASVNGEPVVAEDTDDYELVITAAQLNAAGLGGPGELDITVEDGRIVVWRAEPPAP